MSLNCKILGNSMCCLFKRTVAEVLSVCQLEPSTKNVYVEGISDKLVIDRFLSRQKINDITVYAIETIDFEDVFSNMPPADSELVKGNNKEKVALLALEVEKEVHQCPFLAIIDRDLDFVNNHIKKGKYLSYTDYNSMDMYLYSQDYVDALLKNTFRITSNVNIGNLMDSIGKVCRAMFHVRAYLESSNGSMLDVKKSFSYDKKDNTCALDITKYIQKIIQINKLNDSSEELCRQIEEKVNAPIDDIRLEIKGHDFIQILYLSICKHKKVSMSEEELANTFWVYLDDRQLANEPLFQRICKL